MKRRAAVLASLTNGLAPLPAPAQPAQKMFRIGVLSLTILREKFLALPAALRHRPLLLRADEVIQ